MRKNLISRRKFLQAAVLAQAAAVYHLLVPTSIRAAAQDEPLPEQEEPAGQPDEPAAAAGTVSVHYRPTIIYAKG